MWWARTAGIGLALALVVSMTVAAASAQSFFVTTSKAVYNEGERVVVAGTVSEAGDRRSVLVKITNGDEECASQNIRPQRDGSFVSRPMSISDCGPGDFSVEAIHGDATASNSFSVGDVEDVPDTFELRAMRMTVTHAQDVVNARLREVLDANFAIPERAAEACSKGVAETSLTLQAIDRGEEDVAGEHRQKALEQFRQALDMLSPDKLTAVAEDVREEETRVSASREWLGRLQDLFGRLVDLADKNGLGAATEFGEIDGFLDEAKELIGERRTDSAEESLRSAKDLLEDARKKLVQQAEAGDSDGQALTSAAERLESTARKLRAQADGVPWAVAKVNASFVLINGAKASIANGDYDSAKSSLDSALKALEEAKKIIESRR
jgi:hypothetical protein